MKRKIVSSMLVIIMVMAMITVTPNNAEAFAARSQAEAVAWAKSKIGTGLDYDGAYGVQCVDLIYYYYQYLGVSPQGGNASNYCSNSLPSGWTRIKKSASNYSAQAGDIAVWSWTSAGGSCGHIGIVISSTSSAVTVVDQRGNGHTNAGESTYSYNSSSMTFDCVIRPVFSGASTQTWTKSTMTLGNYFIKNVGSGRYLNVDRGSNVSGTIVSVQDAYPYKAETWDLLSTGTSQAYKFRTGTAHGSTLVLNPYDVAPQSGTSCNLWSDVGDNTQQWYFQKVDNGYVIRLAYNTNLCLSYVKDGTSHLAKVMTYTGASTQIWQLIPNTQFSYTMYFAGNGGTNVPEAKTKYSGQDFQFPTTVPQKVGYKFGGWVWYSNDKNTSATTTKTTGDYAAGAWSRLTDGPNVQAWSKTDSTYVATWTKMSDYTVSYNANGGSGAPSSQTKQYDGNLTLSTTKPTRKGYTFQGWATSANGTVAYAAGETYKANSSITLYAVWKVNTYKISFAGNGGTNIPGSITRTYSQNVTFPSTIPTKTGYTFTGWTWKLDGTNTTITNTDTEGYYKAGATAYASADSNNICWSLSDTTYVACWRPNEYTLYIDDVAVTSYPLVYNGGNWWNIGAPTKNGFTFLGYYTSPSGGELVYDGDGVSAGLGTGGSTYWSDNGSYLGISDLRVYSHWKQNVDLTTGFAFSIENAAKGIKISWNKNASATGYEILRSDDNGSTWKLYKTITSKETLSFVDTGVTNGKTYRYSVRPYCTLDGSTIRPSYPSSKSLVYLQESTFSVENLSNGVKVSWSKNNAATGYELLRWDDVSKTWKMIKSISGTATTSYIDSSATNGSTYKYSVRAVRTANGVTTRGTYPTSKTVVYLKGQNFTVENKGIYIDLSWDKNASATGYEVLRSDDNGVTWKTYKTTTNTTLTFTDTSVVTGKTYKYSVRPYKTVNGVTYRAAWPTSKSLVCLKISTFTVANLSVGIKISWNQNASATGYEIIRSDDGGKTWKLYASVSSNSTISFIDTNVAKGKEYKYSVRAIKSSGSTTYRASYATSKSITCTMK